MEIVEEIDGWDDDGKSILRASSVKVTHVSAMDEDVPEDEPPTKRGKKLPSLAEFDGELFQSEETPAPGHSRAKRRLAPVNGRMPGNCTKVSVIGSSSSTSGSSQAARPVPISSGHNMFRSPAVSAGISRASTALELRPSDPSKLKHKPDENCERSGTAGNWIASKNPRDYQSNVAVALALPDIAKSSTASSRAQNKDSLSLLNSKKPIPSLRSLDELLNVRDPSIMQTPSSNIKPFQPHINNVPISRNANLRSTSTSAAGTASVTNGQNVNSRYPSRTGPGSRAKKDPEVVDLVSSDDEVVGDACSPRGALSSSSSSSSLQLPIDFLPAHLQQICAKPTTSDNAKWAKFLSGDRASAFVVYVSVAACFVNDSLFCISEQFETSMGLSIEEKKFVVASHTRGTMRRWLEIDFTNIKFISCKRYLGSGMHGLYFGLNDRTSTDVVEVVVLLEEGEFMIVVEKMKTTERIKRYCKDAQPGDEDRLKECLQLYDSICKGNIKSHLLPHIDNTVPSSYPIRIFESSTTGTAQNETEVAIVDVAPKRSVRSRRGATSLIDAADSGEVEFIYIIGDDGTDGITITRGDIRRLQPPEYLNDNVIDMQARYFLHHNCQVDKREAVHVFSTIFLRKWRDDSFKYEFNSKWTKGFDLFSKTFAFFPCNEALHWSLICAVRPGLLLEKAAAIAKAMADENSPLHLAWGNAAEDLDADAWPPRTTPEEFSLFIDDGSPDSGHDFFYRFVPEYRNICDSNSGNKSCLLFMDSLNLHSVQKFGSMIVRYLLEEWRHKKGLDVDDFQFQFIRRTFSKIPRVKCNVPMQTNGYDCGVYVLKFMEMVLNDFPGSTQEDINNKFAAYFEPSTFPSEAINELRKEIEDRIPTMKEEWEAKLARRIAAEKEEEEQEAQARKKKKADAFAPAATDAPDSCDDVPVDDFDFTAEQAPRPELAVASASSANRGASIQETQDEVPDNIPTPARRNKDKLSK